MRQTTKMASRWIILLAVLALVAAACGGDGDADGDGEGAAGEGGRVDVLSAFTGDIDVAGFEAMLNQFSEETGIEVVHEGSADFETLVTTRVEGGNPPDIIMHPQPGLLEDLVAGGNPRPLDDVVDLGQLESDMVPGMVELGTFEDSFYGLPVRLSLKSLVWHPIPQFEEAGYTIPETWDDMVALSDQIVSDGATPWCIGIESSGATGWVATDWIEDIMLRLHGPEVYDQWVTNELPFDSPEVREAFGYLEEIWFNEDYVFGGTTNILQTSFGDSILPIFEDPPGCYLHRQASFIAGFFPEDAEPLTDAGFFYLPAIDPGGVGSPVLIAGDLAALYTDNPAAAELIQFMATPEAHEPWAAEGAFLSPFTTFDSSAYADESLAQQAEIVVNADFARFDGSDLMPGPVGAGAFWTELVAWINGAQDLDTTLANIDAAWPAE